MRFGEKDSPASLLDLGTRMLAVLCDRIEPGTEVVAVEEPFAVPLIDQETGEALATLGIGADGFVPRSTP